MVSNSTWPFLVNFKMDTFKAIKKYVEERGCGSTITGFINEACEVYLKLKQ